MPTDAVERALEHFFRPYLADELKILVAFSGGPDSTALLAGLVRVAPHLGLELHAAHLDHGLDPDSARRARSARRLGRRLGVEVAVERLPARERRGRSGPEAAARQARYAFLERRADEVGARFIATAHHADDQAETVLLRLRFGSGVEGLAGIRPRFGRRVRPLLGLRRRELLRSLESASLEGASLETVTDPTNDDLSVPRNHVRHRLLPWLEEREPGITERLLGLSAAAAAAAARLDARLGEHLEPRPLAYGPGIEVPRAAFDALPPVLKTHALALLHRRAGAPYPAGAEARRELARQLEHNPGGRVGCDCGDGWRWETASGRLQLVRPEPSRPRFTYTVEAPGEVEIPELGLCISIRKGRLADWMFQAWPDRAGLAGLATDGSHGCRVEIRNRRPGDRLTPLGCGGRRRLKEVLIDRRVPRRLRDRLPLLLVGGEIAWVPGVTIGERFRLPPHTGRTGTGQTVWIAEIFEIPTPESTESTKAGE